MSETILRQIECLKLLSKDRPRTASEIHKALEVRGFSTTKRTVERDLQMLSSVFGITVEDSQKPFGWRFGDDVALSFMPGLSETEALSFLLLKQFARRLLPMNIEDDLEFYFKNAEKALSENVSKSAVRAWPNKVRIVETNLVLQRPTINPKVQKELHNALFRGQQVEIAYLPPGKAETRTYTSINVLGLVEHGAVIYAVVNFQNYKDVRIIALHRIRAAKMLDTRTVIPVGFNLDTFIESEGMGLGGDGREIQLMLRFYDGSGYPFLETKLSTDQAVLKNSDGIIEISATVKNTMRLKRWLLGLGASVEILAPIDLRKQIKISLADAASRYK